MAVVVEVVAGIALVAVLVLVAIPVLVAALLAGLGVVALRLALLDGGLLGRAALVAAVAVAVPVAAAPAGLGRERLEAGGDVVLAGALALAGAVATLVGALGAGLLTLVGALAALRPRRGGLGPVRGGGVRRALGASGPTSRPLRSGVRGGLARGRGSGPSNGSTSSIPTLLFLMSALGFGMQIAASVVEEKQNRIVEILASAIPIPQVRRHRGGDA